MARKRKFKIPIERTEEILKLYKDGATCVSLGKLLGVNWATVSKFLKKNSVEVEYRHYRKHFFNQNFFEVIDTEAKAYFLGLMYADGSNHKTGNIITIGLQEPDKYILEKFMECLDGTCRLEYFKPDTSGEYNRQGQYKMWMHSAKMTQDLINLGCGYNKTYTLNSDFLHKIPNNLIHHFIRGYFDGDGCVSIHGKSTWSVSFVGTESMMNWLKKYLENQLNLNNRTVINCKYSEILFSLFYSAVADIKKIYNYLYKDATIFLTRKKEKFEKEITITRRSKTGTNNVIYHKKTKKFRAVYRKDLNFPKIRHDKFFKTATEAINFLKSINQYKNNIKSII